MRPLDTITFIHHNGAAGEPPVASSCVGPHPLDSAAMAVKVCQETGFKHPTTMFRSTIQFPAGGDVAETVRNYDHCGKCHLSNTRQRVCHHRGSTSATLCFLGGAPGRDENDLGKPFVGRSGKLQGECLTAAGIDDNRDAVWLNMLGCRPADHFTGDRAPQDGELVACAERTWMMLSGLRPRIVICLGQLAARYFFDETPPIWSFTRFVPPDAPDDWIMVGFAREPDYLVRVIGAPSMYREYAAQRTFYKIVAQELPSLTKVNQWRFLPRYLPNSEEALISWHKTED